ncbi:UvrD-helicase domain-containing protein [Candidatus Peregrinibacteria bacterium]|jgi:DNA helicase II / ATP-dependent DNA helicase PcrA|nr:UvrD-helicase domain-containing protein [Candidatus Peregrinibacteria bacterium]MBT4366577.1 UvrD-helicase domain-containing protein [Candidatus Peregrinibacteria bacterium]MBT4456608.1 UvrD-helicase domain-containing protein [Candidatus Peregrinibacteria bacterium]
MQDDFLSKLNDEQRAAVEHTDGPLLIVAGAGTGKTRVITSRILKLIADERATSTEVLALTFTEKAAQEMVERIDVAMPLGYEEVWIKTFHGFCEKVLRESGHEIGLSNDYKLLDQLDQWVFVKDHIFDFDLEYFRPLGNPGSFINTLTSHFSRIKEEYISPDQYVEYAEKRLKELMEKAKLSAQTKIDKKSVLGIEMEEVRKIIEAANAYKKYQELMLAGNFLDFGDLSYYVLKLFDERPSVLKHYQDRFKYMMVDEFQDTNYAQFKLILMLSGGKDGNICVVGDDDQSIFRWRGASLSNILQFQKEYPEAKKIVLTENYRSNQNVLDSSHHFIKFNDPNRLEHREGIDKNLRSQTKENLPIEVLHCDQYMSEVKSVVKTISDTVSSKDISYRDVAILVRANAHALPFAEELKNAGIPYQIKTPKGLLSISEVKDIVAFCRALSDFSDDVAWVGLMKMPIFEIPMSDIVNVLGNAKSQRKNVYKVLFEERESDALPGLESPLASFVNFIERVIEFSKNHSAGRVISYFLTESGYLEELSSHFDAEHQQKLENVTAFSRVVWSFEKVSDDDSIQGFAKYLSVIEESKIPISGQNESNLASDADSVQILTAHSAKGLEFDTVFICNLVNGRYPILNKKDPLHIPLELTKEIFPEGDFHIEEERRLFYVSLTRAKRKLYLTYSDKYNGPRKWKKSSFLDELAESGLIEEKDVKIEVEVAPEKTAPQKILTAPDGWLKKRSLSFSQIDTFNTCPLKYGYRYVLNVPTPSHHAANFGTSIHETLKDFYRALTDRSVGVEASGEMSFSFLIELFEKNWISNGYENDAHEEARKEQGKKMLEQFFNSNNDPWVIPAYIEKNFNLKIGEYMLNGRIDRIDKLDGGFFEVIDYKTGKSKARLTKENKLQLYIYALACRDVLNIPVKKLTLYYLEDGEKQSLSLSKGYDELDSVRDDVLAYIAAMKESDFTPTPGFLCNYCDYRLICPAV